MGLGNETWTMERANVYVKDSFPNRIHFCYIFNWRKAALVASTRYLSIEAIQSPISIGNDISNRAMLSFNVLCIHSGSPSTFEEDICKIIQDAGLATLGTNMWFGSLAKLPEGTSATGPYVSVVAYGGLSPNQTQNGDKISRPTAQIITRAAGYVVARNKANAIHAAISGQHNITVTQP